MGILLVPGVVGEAWADVDVKIEDAAMDDYTLELADGSTAIENNLLVVTVQNLSLIHISEPTRPY